jgi:hypothetical protein
VPNASVGNFDGTTLSFTKRQTPVVTGITYAIEESTDLGVTDAWAEVSGGTYVNSPTTVSYALTTGTPAKNFVRLKVSQ